MKRFNIIVFFAFLIIFGTAFSATASITALDGFNPNTDGPIYATAVQSDGKILIGGLFSNVGGLDRSNIARLNTDGSVDETFSPVADGSVETIVAQLGGTILIGGSFTSIGGVSRNSIARWDPALNAGNGGIDTAFNPNANGSVYAIAVQPSDGKILIGGAFTSVVGTNGLSPSTHYHIARLGSDGALDPVFGPLIDGKTNAHTDGDVYSIAVQVDGSIILGGTFSCAGQSLCLPAGVPFSALSVATLSSQEDPRRQPRTTSSHIIKTLAVNAVSGDTDPRPGIARLKADGSLDTNSFTSDQLGTIAGAVYTVAVHPNGNVIFGGAFSISKTTPAITATNLARTTFNGVLDSTFSPGPNDSVNTIALQADGRILVGGWFTSFAAGARNHIARFNLPGVLDSEFTADSNDRVYAIAAQSDGKVIVGGSFSSVNQKTQINGNPLNNIVRLYTNGSLEVEFNLNGTVVGEVYAVAVQSGGKVIVGGQFTSIGGEQRTNLARFNADGTLDAAFTPVINDTVYALAVQSDGKILIGGAFNCVGSSAVNCPAANIRNHAARLNSADGSIDASVPLFNPNVNGSVYAIAIQSDNKVLIGGLFTTVSGAFRSNMARLTTDGAPDAFNPNVTGAVRALAIQANGKIVVGGSFSHVGGLPRSRIARLESDGVLDTTGSLFNSAVTDVTGNSVNSIAIHSSNGSILLGGSFSQVGGVARNNLARLTVTSDVASLDPGFDPNVYSASGASVNAIAIQSSDSKIVIGGNFSRVGGPSGSVRNNLARVTSAGAVDGTLNPETNNPVNAVALVGSNIAIGGAFTVVGGNARPFAAMVDPSGVDLGLNNPGNGQIKAIAFQADGKMLVGGTFTSMGGQVGNRIARFNVDGSLDSTFNPNITGTSVNAIAVQADGKILVGGAITGLLVRLNANGTTDTFNHGVAGTSVNAVVIQSDGKILVGGAITGLLVRLNANGTTDTFNHGVAGTSVNAIAVQFESTARKILVGGLTTKPIVRLNSDGTLDTDYNFPAGSLVSAIAVQSDGIKILVGGSLILSATNLVRIPSVGGSNDLSVYPNNTVNAIALAADGTFLIGGSFTQIGAASRPYIARMKSNGSFDASFDALPDNPVTALGLQPDGKVVIGGSFLNVNGQPRYGLAKLNNSGAGGGSLDVPDNTSVTWNRLGLLPEVSRVVFETSPDDLPASIWTPLPSSATRGTNKWSQVGLTLQQNKSFYLRARGYISGGENGGDGSTIEMKRLVYLATKPNVTTLDPDNSGTFWPAMKGTVQSATDTTVKFEYWQGAGTATSVNPVQTDNGTGTPEVISTGGLTTLSRIMAGLPAGQYSYRLFAGPNNHYARVDGGTKTFTVAAATGIDTVVHRQYAGFNIPAGSSNDSSNSITSANCPKITDVNVVLTVDHPKVNDLTVTLRKGIGSPVTLLDPAGLCANADVDIIFDDEGGNFVGTPCNALSPAISGVAKPKSGTVLSNSFEGINDGSAWILTVSSAGQGGTVLGWGLVLTCASELQVTMSLPPGTPTVDDGAAVNSGENPPLMSCSSGICLASFPIGPNGVPLSASATGNWDLDIWSGPDSNCTSSYPNLAACSVIMSGSRQVGATFVEISDFVVPAPVYAGFSAFFTDNSKHGPTSWSWDFGDGTAKSSVQDPGHVYAAPGSFDVTLNVNGATSRFKKKKSVTVDTCVASDPAFPVTLGGNYYATVAGAYAFATPDATIAMLEGVIPMGTAAGGVIAIDKNIILDGGYFCGFVANPDASSSVSIDADTVSIEATGGLIIQ